MRAGSSLTQSESSEARFDESKQRDVLELATRLQREHFETLSASEIEVAAAEAGLDPEFVREAINRIASVPTVKEKPKQVATKEEWFVAIFVPLVVFGTLTLKYISRHQGLGLPHTISGLLLSLGGIGVVALAAVGVRSLVMPQSTALPSQAQKDAQWMKSVRSASPAQMAIYGLLGATILAILTSGGRVGNGSFGGEVLLLGALCPFLGGVQTNAKNGFWRGAFAGVMAGASIYISFTLSQFQTTRFVDLPALCAAGIAVCGTLSIIGYGFRSLFRRNQTPELDRAELLKQLFELQTTLDSHRENRSFLSIDVVGSTFMKSRATELEVEHSFLQYQLWLAEVIRQHGGEVQAVAGDGAMAMFRDPLAAVTAARALQKGIHAFNAQSNRLSTPFVIRCGVAEGRVGLDARTPLGMVHSQVVDRAALLQKSAQPGSIVVQSDLIAVAMPILESLSVLTLVDGSTAYTSAPVS